MTEPRSIEERLDAVKQLASRHFYTTAIVELAELFRHTVGAPPEPLPETLPIGTRTLLRPDYPAITELKRGDFGGYWGLWKVSGMHGDDQPKYASPSAIDWSHYYRTHQPAPESAADADRFGPESFRFTTRGVEYELAKYSPLGTVACTEEDLIVCLAAIPDEPRTRILEHAIPTPETWAIFFCYPDGDWHQTFELVRAYNSRDAAERSLAGRVRGCPTLIDGAEDTYPVHVSARAEFEEGARGEWFWLIERLDVQT